MKSRRVLIRVTLLGSLLALYPVGVVLLRQSWIEVKHPPGLQAQIAIQTRESEGGYAVVGTIRNGGQTPLVLQNLVAQASMERHQPAFVALDRSWFDGLPGGGEIAAGGVLTLPELSIPVPVRLRPATILVTVRLIERGSGKSINLQATSP